MGKPSRSEGFLTTTAEYLRLAQPHLRVLSAVSAEPLATYKRLAYLSGCSVQTFKHKFAQLCKASILQTIWARVAYSALNLQVVPVLATVSVANIANVEKACDLHPYTRYRARCLGSTNGLFMRFAIPQGTEFQLIEFLDTLKQLTLIEDYTIPRFSAETVYVNPDFTYYNIASDTWQVKIKSWADALGEHADELQQFASSHLSSLDLKDLQLIRHLTMDARKPQKALSKELQLPEYDVSRRLKFIFDNRIVLSFEVVLGKKVFPFGPLALFQATCNMQTTRSIATGIRKLPFQSWLSPTNDGFLLFAGLPTSLFTEIGTVILERSKNVKISWIDYDTSMRYYFDETPYDENKGEWRTDRELVIEEPISILKKELVK
jgi:DNA-binding Lrp family transcriptional regulator